MVSSFDIKTGVYVALWHFMECSLNIKTGIRICSIWNFMGSSLDINTGVYVAFYGLSSLGINTGVYVALWPFMVNSQIFAQVCSLVAFYG